MNSSQGQVVPFQAGPPWTSGRRRTASSACNREHWQGAPASDHPGVLGAAGSGGKGLVIGPAATGAELDELALEVEADPRHWIAQRVVALSTSPTSTRLNTRPSRCESAALRTASSTRCIVSTLCRIGSSPRYRLFGSRASVAEAGRALELLAEFNLADYAHRPAGVLSYGQRKLLEFASVLMDEPSLVLLDEPTAGISPVMKETVGAHVRSRNEKGVTFLIVEHEMSFVMSLCEQIVVLDRGRPIACDTPEAVQEDPRVLDAYLGD